MGNDGDEDIEAALQRELEGIKAKNGEEGSIRLFTPIKPNVHCLLFIKAGEPIEPVGFVRRICQDAAKIGEGNSTMKSRYVNRLTPVSKIGKATEQGLVEVARAVLSPWFDLTGKTASAEPVADCGKADEPGSHPCPAELSGNGTEEARANTKGVQGGWGEDKRAVSQGQNVQDVQDRPSYSVIPPSPPPPPSPKTQLKKTLPLSFYPPLIVGKTVRNTAEYPQ